MTLLSRANETLQAMEFLRPLLEQLPGHSRHSQPDLDRLYGLGCKLYSQGKYEHASQIFSLLTLYRPLEADYLYANGLTQKQIKRPQLAAQLFSSAMQLAPENPMPPMLAAECLLGFGARKEALAALEMALEIIRENPEHAHFRERIIAWMALAKGKDGQQ